MEAAETYSIPRKTEFRIDETRLVHEEDIPTAVGWRMIVQPVPVEEVSKGGILLPSETQKANALLTYVGKVLSMGPLCYQSERFSGADAWCKVGDYVVFGQYQGQRISFELDSGDNVDLMILNDDEVRAVATSPEKLRAYV